MATRRVLVTGGAGWTGCVLVPLLRSRGFEVMAPGHAELDVIDASAVHTFVNEHRPDAVIHLAAARPGSYAVDLTGVNEAGTRAVSMASAAAEARLVHVSTDMVFDGTSPPYDEDREPNPINPYGRSKAAGETAVLASQANAAIVRTSLLWDPLAIDRGTAAFAESLARGAAYPLFTDEVRCPLTRTALAECLVRLVDRPWCGPLHVAGREALSRHAFMTSLLEHFGIEGFDAVETVRAADLEAAGAPRRPRDLRLRIDRAEDALGVRLPGVSDQLTS